MDAARQLDRLCPAADRYGEAVLLQETEEPVFMLTLFPFLFVLDASRSRTLATVFLEGVEVETRPAELRIRCQEDLLRVRIPPQEMEAWAACLDPARDPPRATDGAVWETLGPEALLPIAHVPAAFGKADARVWVCSWNMGAKDTFRVAADLNRDEKRAAYEAHVQELSDVIPEGYDVYAFGVQECISNTFYDLVDVCLRRRHCFRITLPQEQDRCWGRGDGSFINQKYTGIALFVSQRIAPLFKLLGATSANLSRFEGSKGGAAVAIRIHQTTIALVSSHLPAKSVEDRRRGFRALTRSLGRGLGCPRYDLQSQFHHVVFFGDLNYRTHGIKANEVLQLIAAGDAAAIRKYDELDRDRTEGAAFLHYVEPEPRPDFYPTYKKKEDRPRDTDWSSPAALENAYRTLYKEPWYKKGREKVRIPSYCDRVLLHALEGAPAPMRVEKVNGVPQYGCLSDALLGSDHSAVVCGLELGSVLEGAPPGPPATMTLTLEQVHITTLGQRVIPSRASVLFPVPFACSDAVGDVHTATKEDFAVQWRLTEEQSAVQLEALQARWTGPVPAEGLHVLLRVDADAQDVSGECVFYLTTSQFKNGARLHLSLPLLHRGCFLTSPSNGTRVAVELDLQLGLLGS